MLQVLLTGCGDGDHTDEWVGKWTLKMWNGEKNTISEEANFKEGQMEIGGTMERWDFIVEEFKITAEFTLGMIVVGNL